MSKKRKTTNVGRVVKNGVEAANIHRRRLKINLGVIRVDFECKALNEEQRKQLQEHALKEETRRYAFFFFFFFFFFLSLSRVLFSLSRAHSLAFFPSLSLSLSLSLSHLLSLTRSLFLYSPRVRAKEREREREKLFFSFFFETDFFLSLFFSSWVDKQNQNFYSFEGSILPLSELMQTFCLEYRDAQKALGVSYRTYQGALEWYGIKKVTSSTAISIRNGEDCFSPEKKKKKGLAEDACPERTYVWFCLLSLKDRGYVNDQNATNIRNREKKKNIETDFSDRNGRKLNQWQVDSRRNQRKQYPKQYLKKKEVGFGFPKPFHGSECPLCRCSGSERWFSLPRLAKDFVTMGRETGNRNTAEEVISAWCEAEKGLTEEMFDSERPNLLRDLCLDCYYVQFATFAQAFGITRFSLPGRMRKNRKYPERSAVMMNARFNGN